MQLVRFAAVPALAAAAVAPIASPALAYGPGKCVSIGRAATANTCVLSTRCAGQNIESFDFSFDCLTAIQGRTPHSFGIGSLDTEEEFDTGIVCDACLPPKDGAVLVPASTMPLVAAVAKPAKHASSRHVSPRHTSPKHASQKHASPKHASAKLASAAAKPKGAVFAHHAVHAAKARAPNGTSLLQHARHMKEATRAQRRDPDEEDWSAQSKVERYGPSGCVSTWKDESNNHCMIQTDCDGALSADLAVYEFGLLCRQEDGDTVRHLFGQNSFDEHETFDTLIECQQCLALDEYMDAHAAVQQLAQEVSVLSRAMSNITADLARLNQAVLKPPAPPVAPAAPPPPAADAAKLVARRSGGSRHSGQQQGKRQAAALRGASHRAAAKATVTGAARAATKTVARRAALDKQKSHGAAKATARAASHRGASGSQQKRASHRAARHGREEARSEDVDDEGDSDVDSEAAAVSVDEVRRDQRKSKSDEKMVVRRHRRDADEVDEDAGSNEQDEVQDDDEADSQDDEDSAQEDGQSEDDEGDDADEESDTSDADQREPENEDGAESESDA